MMRKRIWCAALCCFVFCMSISGCGERRKELTWIGGETEENAALEADAFPGWEMGAESDNDEQTGDERVKEEALSIYVYVCGAVQNPGVVALPEGSRADAALEAAGGFRADARTDYVNLAARLTDGEKLYFPTVEEAETADPEEADDGLVHINTAEADALCTLPGIGASRAEDIIRYRETVGRFETPEDIMKVPGIKTSVYQKIRDRITVQ